MSKVKSYLSLIKFSHTIFAMPFALIGFFLGIMYPISLEYNAGQWNLNKTVGWGREKDHDPSGWTVDKMVCSKR
jgi:4-hydroxybenzoate polyprenyltransferase